MLLVRPVGKGKDGMCACALDSMLCRRETERGRRKDRDTEMERDRAREREGEREEGRDKEGERQRRREKETDRKNGRKLSHSVTG